MQPLHHATRRSTPPTAPAQRSVGGFTLIELLVVVGIIAVLMAILLPALGRARAEVHKISCASNLRQYGTALNSFSNDRDNALPNPGGPWDAENTPARQPIANDNRPFFHVNVATRPNHEWVGFYNSYLAALHPNAVMGGDRGVQHCPVGWQSHLRGWTAEITMGYVYLPNRGAAHFNPEVHGWVNKTRFDAGYARAPIMMDVYQRAIDTNELVAPGSDEFNNHVSSADPDSVLGGNFLFEDGSVSWYNQDEIEPGMEPVRDWPHRLHFKIDVPGLVD